MIFMVVGPLARLVSPAPALCCWRWATMCSRLEKELSGVLSMPGDPDSSHPAQQQGGSASTDGMCDDALTAAAAAWAAAMSAFAAALPMNALLRVVQQAATAGTLHPQRAADLLLAAGALPPAAAATPLPADWAAAQAATALQQRTEPLLRSMLLLQRRLLPGGEGYAAWLRGLAVQAAGAGQGELALLVGGVLTPQLPEDPLPYLRQQVAVLAALKPQLPPAAGRQVEEYLAAAQQRVRALAQQQVAAAAEGGGAGGGGGSEGALRSLVPPPSEESLRRGQRLLAGLLADFRVAGGRLEAGRVQELLSRAKNTFTKVQRLLAQVQRPWPASAPAKNECWNIRSEEKKTQTALEPHSKGVL